MTCQESERYEAGSVDLEQVTTLGVVNHFIDVVTNSDDVTADCFISVAFYGSRDA